MLNQVKFENLCTRIDATLTDTSKIMDLHQFTQHQANKEIQHYRDFRTEARKHDLQARRYVLNLYSTILRTFNFHRDNEGMKRLIDFDDYSNNEDRVLLEMLMMVHDLSYYLDKYGIGTGTPDKLGMPIPVDPQWAPEVESRRAQLEEINKSRQSFELDENIPAYLHSAEQITTEELMFPRLIEVMPENFTTWKLRFIVKQEEKSLRNFFDYSHNRLNLLSLMCYSCTFGIQELDTLGLQNINEVGARDKNYIYIIHKGIKIWLSFLAINLTEQLAVIQKESVDNSSSKMQTSNPSVIASKNNGSRIAVAGFDFTANSNELYYNERIFTLSKIPLQDMWKKYNTLNEQLFIFLLMSIAGRMSFFVSGADMNVGKSTLLAALLAETPRKWGIGMIDPQNEMQMSLKYPDLNCYTLTLTKNRTIEDCFEIILKQARDIVCVSELTNSIEMGELVKATTRLNSGAGTTLHSISPEAVMHNSAELLMGTGRYDTRSDAEYAVAQGMRLIIQVARISPTRIIIDSISEIVPLNRDIEVTDLKLGIEYSKEEKELRVLDLQQQYYAKQLYSKPYKINHLFRYNRSTDAWDQTGKPTKDFMDKMAVHLNDSQMLRMYTLFNQVGA